MLQPARRHPTHVSSKKRKSLLLEAPDVWVCLIHSITTAKLTITLSHVLMFSSVQSLSCVRLFETP